MLTAFIILALCILGLVLLIRTERVCKLPEDKKFDPEQLLKSLSHLGKKTIKKAKVYTNKINPFVAKKQKVEILSKPVVDENGNEKSSGTLRDLLEVSDQKDL